MGFIFSIIRNLIHLVVSFVVNVLARSIILGMRIAVGFIFNSMLLKIAFFIFLAGGILWLAYLALIYI